MHEVTLKLERRPEDYEKVLGAALESMEMDEAVYAGEIALVEELRSAFRAASIA